jgi:dienelactone hydrolase
MNRGSRNDNRARWVVAVAAVLLIALSWLRVSAAGRDLVVRDMAAPDGTPLRFLAPAGASDIPGVIVAHGFAGSKQLMYGFGYDLARAGYGVVLLDFDGHGAARGRLDRAGGALQRNLASAYAVLVAQPEIDPARIALLGHSMGSGAVMTAGIDAPERYRATVAVSPTGAAVTPDAPRNLLLMAGSLEPQFLGNARDLLARAGGPNDDLSAGLGRALVEVPNVEHITILFSRTARQAALDWLNEVFSLPPVEAIPDRRMVWLGVHLGAWFLLLWAVAPRLPAAEPDGANRRRPWHWLGLVVGVLVAAAALFLAGRLFDASRLGGLLVGGALGLWFLAAGLVWLLAGFRVPRPAAADAAWGGLLFLFLSLALGAMSQVTWLPWLLIVERLARWPFLAAAVLPFLLASALAQHGARPAARAGWWLLQSAVVVAGLGLTLVLSPNLFFIALLLPVFPVILGIMGLAGAALGRPWAVAIGNALFLGWLLVAVFPLA